MAGFGFLVEEQRDADHTVPEEQLQPLLYTLRLPCRTRSIKEELDFPTKRWTWESGD